MKYPNLIIFVLISVIIADSFRIISTVGELNLESSTYLSTILIYISIIILLFIFTKSEWTEDVPKSIRILFIFWIMVNVINVLRGFFVVKDYWDWKYLMITSFTFSLVPFAFFLGNNFKIAKHIIKLVFKYLLPFGFLLIPLSFATNEELYPRIMIMISLFILFIPFVKTKWKLLIISVSVVSLLLVLGFRTNIIKISISYIILFTYYFLGIKKKFNLNFARLFLFALPVVLFFLAVSLNFNIFDQFSRIKGYIVISKTGKIENTAEDTRTFLYVEVLSQLYYGNSFFFGESAAGYYESKVFFNEGGAMGGKRYESEVGILNILLRYGIIGVISYFLLLFAVSNASINHSNNDLSKMIGLFIASRWVITFFEEFTQYDINFLFFWLVIGLVSSTSFRKMSNNEIKIFLKLK